MYPDSPRNWDYWNAISISRCAEHKKEYDMKTSELILLAWKEEHYPNDGGRYTHFLCNAVYRMAHRLGVGYRSESIERFIRSQLNGHYCYIDYYCELNLIECKNRPEYTDAEYLKNKESWVNRLIELCENSGD